MYKKQQNENLSVDAHTRGGHRSLAHTSTPHSHTHAHTRSPEV